MSATSVTDYSSESESFSHYIAGGLRMPGSEEAGASPPLGDVLKNCLSAVETLRNVASDSERLFREDAVKNHELETAFYDVLLFVEAEASGHLLGHTNKQYRQCIASIFDGAFLHAVLDIRRWCLQSSRSNKSDCSNRSVYCVETLFACWPKLVSSLTGTGTGSVRSQQDTLKYPDANLAGLQSHFEMDMLIISRQLPQNFQQIPDLLQSNQASPALKRLALCILFTTFVVRPDINDCDAWKDSWINPGHVLECLAPLLDGFLDQAKLLPFPQSDPILHPLRMAYAMAVVLFAQAEMSVRQQNAHNPAPFEPYTSARLLELITVILPPLSRRERALISRDTLDVAQAILLHWGRAIPWAWGRWDDARVLGFDAVVTLTSNWLYHLDEAPRLALLEEPLARNEGVLMLTERFATVLSNAVRVDPRASLVALVHQLDGDHKFDPVDNENLQRLFRASWCLSELTDTSCDSLSLANLSSLASQLFLLYADLSQNHSVGCSKVKEEVVHCLGFLKPYITEEVVASLRKDVSFFTKINRANASLMVTGDPSGRFLCEPGIPSGLATILEFICLFYKCDMFKCLPTMTFSFLSDMLKFLSERTGTAAVRIALLECLVHANGHCRQPASGMAAESTQSTAPAKLHKTWNDEDVYNVALNMTGTNLDLAAAFASYVSLTIKKSTDTLLVSEAWCYLCDVLHQVLIAERWGDLDRKSGHRCFDERTAAEKQALRIVVAIETICNALETIVKRGDTVAARLLKGSPTTFRLSRLLNKIREFGTIEDADTSNRTVSRSPRTEEIIRLDIRVVKKCEQILEKFEKWRGVEKSLNLSS